MEVYNLKKSDEKEWDDYVMRHPDSTFYHQVGWKNVIEKSYGHKHSYLFVKEKEEILGVLPMFLMKSLFFGTKLVSVPFAPYGGAVGDCVSVENLLIGSAIEISEKENAKYMELRNNKNRESKLSSNTNYMTLILKLEKDPGSVWQRFNNKVRNSIRKSLNSELETYNGSVKEFYKLYSKNMRDLGTPTHSKEFFSNVVSEFKENAEILSVRQNCKPVSAAILLYFRDIVISGWAASDREFRNFSPNNLLYWSAIKNACEKGYKFFDFGRSIKGSGTYGFKKPWGAEEKQLQYLYYLNGIRQIPDSSQANLERQLFARVWQTLPISITNALGTKLRGNLP
jgi:serine/alanine adding enzyme